MAQPHPWGGLPYTALLVEGDLPFFCPLPLLTQRGQVPHPENWGKKRK